MSSVTPRRVLALALLAFALRVRFDWQFRRRVCLAVIGTALGQQVILKLTRLLLGYVIPPVLVQFWYVWPSHHAQDGLPYFEHLKYVRRARYGPHPREELDELHPVDGEEYHAGRAAVTPPSTVAGLAAQMLGEITHLVSLGFGHHPHGLPVRVGKVRESAPCILFGHGGGWVCQGTDVQLGQLPAIARAAGMAVYSFNYPLAPEDPFPVAVVSTLRALSYLRTHRGYDAVALLGESAGGNLISMAALFACNPHLLRRLAIESKVNVDEWVYPRVSCVVSWYSILDEKAWRGGEWLSPGLAAVWDMYLPSGALGELQGRATICQWEEEIHAYPPTLLIVGSYDPLGLRHSSEAALQMLQRRNVPVQLRVFDATHGFVGYPPQMQSALNGGDPSHWLQNCAEATKATVGFLKENHGHEQRLPGPVR